MITAFKNIIKQTIFPLQEKGSVEAYDIWAEQYDAQSGNLMMDLDAAVFAELLKNVDITGKHIADIGCGTGRHWAHFFRGKVASVSGFDVSQGMLDKLLLKYPSAQVHQIENNFFADIPDAQYDLITSTLTIAHIENIDEALDAWCRMLRQKGDVIITDFHPNALAFGGKRTFEHKHRSIAVKNFVHHLPGVEYILKEYGLSIVNKIEREVDESVKHYYEAKKALPVYEKFKGSRIIYGLHLRRGYDIA